MDVSNKVRVKAEPIENCQSIFDTIEATSSNNKPNNIKNQSIMKDSL